MLPNLLRFDFNGDTATNNIGDLFVFDCEGVGKDRKCSLDNSAFSTDLNEDSAAMSYLQVMVSAVVAIMGYMNSF